MMGSGKYASSRQLPLSVRGEECVDVGMHHSDDSSEDGSNPGNVGVFSFGTVGDVAYNCKDNSDDDDTNNTDDGNDDADSADDGFGLLLGHLKALSSKSCTSQFCWCSPGR